MNLHFSVYSYIVNGKGQNEEKIRHKDLNSGAKLKRDFGHLVLDVVEKYECEFFDEVAADQDFDLQRDVPNKDNFERLYLKVVCSSIFF